MSAFYPNSTIKIKYGHCIDCGPNEPDKALKAGRCDFHYKKHRAEVNARKPSNKAKQAIKEVNGIYLASQTLTMPKTSEESGLPLPQSPAWLKKSCAAHILAKRTGFGGFPSVALHPQNFIFLTPDEHSNMDNLGEMYIVKMRCLPLMKERVKELMKEMPDEEIKKIPHYFL